VRSVNRPNKNGRKDRSNRSTESLSQALARQAIVYDNLLKEGIIHNLKLPTIQHLPSTIVNNKLNKRGRWTEFYRRKSINRFLIRMPCFCNTLWGVSPSLITSWLSEYIQFYEKMCLSKGPGYTVKWFKSLHSIASRYMSNHTFPKMDYVTLHKSHGIPLLFNKVLPLMDGTLQERQCILFLVQFYKLAKVENVDDISVDTIIEKDSIELDNRITPGSYLRKASINEGYTEKRSRIISNCFKQVLEEMFPEKGSYKRLESIRALSTLHISTRNGPNGLSLLTAPIDWIALGKDKKLKTAIIDMSRLLRNKSLNMVLGCFRLMPTKIIENKKKLLQHTSKLSTKVEPGGKMRVFAIGDWFSQSVLKGFHNYIFSVLSKYVNDGTMSHSKLASKISVWTTDEEIYRKGIYSVDLTAATDLLPCLFQKEIVFKIAGRRFAELWYTIMSQREFVFNDLNLLHVKYGKGQPMGLYSSWGMLAITHHVVCRTALKLSNIRYDEDSIQFGIIGDDIALYGQKFYKNYLLLMSTLLRVPINQVKGFTPDTVSDFNPIKDNLMTNVVEIAKRIFYNGEELTTITPNSAMAGLEKSESFPSMLNELSNRGLLKRLSTPRCIRLATLSFNPRVAMELATFPPAPALPFQEGVSCSEETPKWLYDIPWIKHPNIKDYLNRELCRLFRSKLVPSLRRNAMAILEYRYDRTSWTSHSYTYTSKPYVYLLRLASKLLMNRIDLVDFQTRSNSVIFDVSELRSLLDSITVCSDVNLLLCDLSRDNKDTKEKTAVLLKKIIRSISLDMTEHYDSQFTVSDGIIDMFKNNILIKPDIVKIDSPAWVITRVDEFIDISSPDDDYSEWDITIE
jgi:hypothetical protein